MTAPIIAQPLTATAFAPFGDVLAAAGPPDRLINQGLCERFHDRARLDFGTKGRAGISTFNAQPRALPYRLEMMERHPDGSQAFIPMTGQPFLVIVAPDAGGAPGLPRAFLTAPGQGINLLRGTWHGVLTPLHAPGLFAVIDRIGPTPNLEEHWFAHPFVVHAPAPATGPTACKSGPPPQLRDPD
jgi:ureidoglycolate lyase